MCGLVGIAGVITTPLEKTFKLLLQLDTIRGKDSTGVLSVANKYPQVLKKIGTPWELAQYAAWPKLFNRNHNLLMGHNRAATKGVVNNANAHPFTFENVIGSHNGTLRGQYRLPNHTEYEVDSENIFHAIDTIGIHETAKKLDGAYALSWWDKRNNSINLLRNSERPLFITTTKDSKTLLWASEKWMLIVASQKNNVEIEECVELPIHTMLSANLNDVTKITKEELEVYTPPPVTNVVSYPYNNHYINPNETEAEKKLKKLVGKEVLFFVDSYPSSVNGRRDIDCSSVGDCLPLVLYMGHDKKFNDKLLKSINYFVGKVTYITSYQGVAGVIAPSSVREVDITSDFQEDDYMLVGPDLYGSTAEYIDGTENGCGWCGNKITLADADKIMWVDTPHEVLCPKCAKDKSILRQIKEVKHHA
jgi:predicted glutamine amidotransferase